MSVLWVGFNLHKTLLSIIDLVTRFQEWFSAEREKSFLVCRTSDNFDRRYSEIIQGIRDPLQMKNF